MNRRELLKAAAALPLAPAVLSNSALAQGAAPEVKEMTMGDPNAPVTLVEYAMFTCPHCAAFNRDVFPQIKENFIDTGKVKLVFRDREPFFPCLCRGRRVPVDAEDVRQRADQRTVVVDDEDRERLSRRGGSHSAIR